MKGKRVIAAKRVSRKVLSQMGGDGPAAKITAIFDRSFLLETGKGFLAHIGTHRLSLTPRSILIPEADYHRQVAPQINLSQPVFFADGGIDWRDIPLAISIAPAEAVDLQFSSRQRFLPEAVILENLNQAMAEAKRSRGDRRDVSPLSDYFLSHRTFNGVRRQEPKPPRSSPFSKGQGPWFDRSELWDRIDHLCRMVRETHGENIAESLRGLIGLGPGLTPSGDDFLAGFISAGIAVSRAWPGVEGIAEKMAETTLREAAGRTTTVSMAMLEDARQGEMSEPMISFLDIVLITGEMKRVPSLMEDILSIGASSGEDQLNGLASGIRFFGELAVSLEAHRT